MIKASKEGQNELAKLLDIALKAGGMQSYQFVTEFMGKVIPMDDVEVAAIKAKLAPQSISKTPVTETPKMEVVRDEVQGIEDENVQAVETVEE